MEDSAGNGAVLHPSTSILAFPPSLCALCVSVCSVLNSSPENNCDCETAKRRIVPGGTGVVAILSQALRLPLFFVPVVELRPAHVPREGRLVHDAFHFADRFPQSGEHGTTDDRVADVQLAHRG